MIRTGLLLAAGASRRFGPDDKLLAPLRGQPLIGHAARAMRAVPLDRRIAVIANPALAPHLAGFDLVTIAPAALSDSLRAGLEVAGLPDRLLIALGDMPDVTPEHLARVLDGATDDLPSASVDGGFSADHEGSAPMPPACFPRACLPLLRDLRGDQGAGRLLRDLPPAQLRRAAGLLRDIDRLSDL